MTIQASAGLEISLPYEQIEALASIEEVLANPNITAGNMESKKLPFGVLLIRQAFNFEERNSLDIKELAESIITCATNKDEPTDGLLEPLYVDVLKDGRIFVERGHRRYYAIRYIIDVLGLRFPIVEVFINRPDTTELQRHLNLRNTNLHARKLTLLQEALHAYRTKHFFTTDPMPNIEVGKLLGISRQKVDYLILFAEQPDDVKLEIKMQEMNYSKAKAYIDSLKKTDKSADDAEMKANQTDRFSPGVNSPDVNANDLKISKELEDQIEDEEGWQPVNDTIEPDSVISSVAKAAGRKPRFHRVGNSGANSKFMAT